MAGFANQAAFFYLIVTCLFQCFLCVTPNVTGDDIHLWLETNDTDLVTTSPEGDLNLIVLDDLEEGLSITETENACAMDIFRVLLNVDETWAQQMLDAAAKPPSGIMDMNVNWLGNFYECQNVRAPATNRSAGFTGRYCTVSLSLGGSNTSAFPVTTGVCVPNTCAAKDLTNLMNITLALTRSLLRNFTNSSLLKVGSISCSLENSEFDAAAIGTLFLLSVFSLLIIAGTAVTVVENFNLPEQKPDESPAIYTVLENSDRRESNVQEVPPAPESTLKQFLKCFCIITNGSKMLTTNVRGDLRCVHGIRFLSMSWVILGHTYAFGIMNTFSGDVRELLQDIDNLAFQAIMQGTFSVDSFFLLSGFLLCYLFLKEANKTNGKIPWGFFYIHRYWRLTPVYAIVLAFNTALTVYVAEGPLWPNGSSDVNCRTSWWWNLLYINNFQPQGETCMGWSWYLANDMQFYVISPVILYVLWRWPKIGLSLISGLMITSWIATAFISYHHFLLPGYTRLLSNPDWTQMQIQMSDYFEKLYIKPYTRIGPYLIGIVLGYAVTQQLTHNKPLPKIWVLVGWVLASAAGLGMVYGFYHSHLGKMGAAVYNALSRSVFSASLAWLIFACLSGNGGLVNTILSWKFLIPLSRLTYCAYLVHPIIIISFYQSIRSSFQVTHMLMVTLFLGFMVMSYVTALICSLAFESSLMAVEKLVISKSKKKTAIVLK